jgi:hypothetical protein
LKNIATRQSPLFNVTRKRVLFSSLLLHKFTYIYSTWKHCNGFHNPCLSMENSSLRKDYGLKESTIQIHAHFVYTYTRPNQRRNYSIKIILSPTKKSHSSHNGVCTSSTHEGFWNSSRPAATFVLSYRLADRKIRNEDNWFKDNGSTIYFNFCCCDSQVFNYKKLPRYSYNVTMLTCWLQL